MFFLLRLIINAVALLVTAWAIPGIHLGAAGPHPTTNDWVTLLIVALIFGWRMEDDPPNSDSPVAAVGNPHPGLVHLRHQRIHAAFDELDCAGHGPWVPCGPIPHGTSRGTHHLSRQLCFESCSDKEPVEAGVRCWPTSGRRRGKTPLVVGTGSRFQRALTEAVEQQAAMSKILRIISTANLHLRDGEFLPIMEHSNITRAKSGRAVAEVCLLASARVIRDRAPLNIADAHTDPRKIGMLQHAYAGVRGYRSQVVVPLLRHDEAVGTVGVTRLRSAISSSLKPPGQPTRRLRARG